MIDLVMKADDMAKIRSSLLQSDIEHCAVLFASQATRLDGSVRLLVRDTHFPNADDYLSQQTYEAILRPGYVAQVAKHAKLAKQSLVFVHSHPGGFPPEFSPTDDKGEQALAGFLRHRIPDRVHGAMVVGEGGLQARQLGTREYMRVIALGENRSLLTDPSLSLSGEKPEEFDRQVRAFGREGQEALERITVGIVGLGGTGSIVAEQLAHLGVRRFVLLDPDVIEITNLNRVVGASHQDIGKPKVDVAARYIQRISPVAIVKQISGDIIRAQFAKHLFDVDILFGCTDSHGSRAVLQQIAYQYLIPCIDLGTTITTAETSVSGIFGRVQLLSPGVGCFTCAGLLDAEQVRRDMMTAYERKLDPYIQGAHEPAPAVISLNGTMASLAVTMLLSYVAGVPSRARHIIYNAVNSTLRSVRVDPKPNCYICSAEGTYGRGDSIPLYARQD